MPQGDQDVGGAFKWAVMLCRILDDRGVTAASALVADLDLSSSARHRMLDAMQAQGLIARVGHGRYDVGVSLAASLAGVSPLGQLARVARPPLTRLAKDMNTSVHLGVLDGDMATYLVKISAGRGADTLFTREGGQLEAYCTAIGKVLLASLSHEDQLRYCASGPFVRLTVNTIVDPDQLSLAIVQAGIQGWACDDHEMADGLYCVALPVRDANSRVVAAASMSFPRVERGFRPGNDRVERLRDAIGRIERLIGRRNR